MEIPHKAFNLTRYFVVTSAIVILIAAIIVSIIFSRLARQQMIEESEDDTISLTTQIKQDVEPLLLTLLAAESEATSLSLRQQLESQLAGYHDGWDVILVRFYDPSGRAIFSSVDRRLDYSLSDTAGLEQALSGEAWSEFEELDENESQAMPDHIVETYVPVFAGDGRQVIGVLEVYRDVVADYDRAARVQAGAVLSVTVAIGSLFVVLALIVRRGDRLLAQTNLRFSNVLSATTDAIICTDQTGRITLWNNAATRMFGYAPQEMLGQTYDRLVAPEARSRTRLLTTKGEQPHQLPQSPIVTTAIHRNGAIIPVEINVSTYRQGSNHEFAAVVRDISQRRRAEMEINRHVEDLTILGAVATAVNQSSSLDHVLLAALGEIEARLGLPYSEVWLLHRDTGTLRPHTHYGFPDDFAQEVSAFVTQEGLPDIVAEAGQSIIVQDLATQSTFEPQPGRRYKLQSALGVPLMTQEKLVGVIVFFTDSGHRFTPGVIACLATVGKLVGTAVERAWLYENSLHQAQELERLNQELKEHAARLEDRVAERTVALKSALKKARESDRLKSEFVSNVNHELRTPLSSIKLALDLFPRLSAEKQVHYLGTMRRETVRLERLIEDLLEVSRLDLGQIQLQMEAVDLNQLWATLVADRQALVENCGLSLVAGWESNLPPAWGDPSLLNQVATNLLTNAMNYTPPGGQITLTTSTRTVGGQTWITFTVADTGPGIDPDDRPHLFERFYRGRVGKAASAPGTGLGLAISKEILDLHDGRIEVQSRPGKGSAFTIWLHPATRHVSQNGHLTPEKIACP